jgi:transcription antitermination protein NusB
MKRRKERERVLQVLYALEYNPIPVEELLNQFETPFKKDVSEFSQKLIEIANVNKVALDTLIKEHIFNWDFSRLAIIDKILLRMAAAELLYFEDIPPEVTLNEIIEISKIYSTDRSGKFLNGILDAILKDVRSGKVQLNY